MYCSILRFTIFFFSFSGCHGSLGCFSCCRLNSRPTKGQKYWTLLQNEEVAVFVHSACDIINLAKHTTILLPCLTQEKGILCNSRMCTFFSLGYCFCYKLFIVFYHPGKILLIYCVFAYRWSWKYSFTYARVSCVLCQAWKSEIIVKTSTWQAFNTHICSGVIILNQHICSVLSFKVSFVAD